MAEYFVKELDEEKSEVDKSLIGSEWFVSRFVHRVGYKFEPKNMPREEVYEQAEKLIEDVVSSAMLQNSNLEKADVEKIAARIIADMHDLSYPFPEYRAKGILVDKKNKEEKEKWRRIWFEDFKKNWPYQPARKLKIIRIDRFWTGKYYSPSGGYYDGEYDYEPGGLSPSFYQSLYFCQVYYQTEAGNWLPDCLRLIHPKDLMKENPDKNPVKDAPTW